uniref:Uncharacterized protein n=1 Tax=Brassica campestris TaxID=3711 RepID=M4EFT0_BRACM
MCSHKSSIHDPQRPSTYPLRLDDIYIPIYSLTSDRNIHTRTSDLKIQTLIMAKTQLTTKQLTKLIPENAGGFKSLIKILPAQAVKLLYFSDSPSSSSQAVADGSDIGECLCEDFGWFFIGWVLLDTHSVHNLGIVLLLFLLTQ